MKLLDIEKVYYYQLGRLQFKTVFADRKEVPFTVIKA